MMEPAGRLDGEIWVAPNFLELSALRRCRRIYVAASLFCFVLFSLVRE